MAVGVAQFTWKDGTSTSRSQNFWQDVSGNIYPMAVNTDGAGNVLFISGSPGYVNLAQVGGSPLSLGQQVASASVPVVLTAAQLTSLTAAVAADEATFTAGTTTFTASGGVFNDSIAGLSSGQQGAVRLTPNRAKHVNLRSQNGTELGTTANPVQVALATGLTAADDTVTAQPAAAATGGASVSRTISAATTNANNVKASAGTLYSLRVTNFNTTSARYVHVYNSATTPTAGAGTPVDTVAVPAAASASQPTVLVWSGPAVGVAFSAGIGFTITGALADTDATAVGANDLLLTIVYQ